MARSSNLSDATSALVAAAGTSVNPVLAVPDNCTEILILNTSSTNTLYVSCVVAAPDPLNKDTSTNIPPGGSVTLAIGTLADRPGPASYVYDADAAPTFASITYKNANV